MVPRSLSTTQAELELLFSVGTETLSEATSRLCSILLHRTGAPVEIVIASDIFDACLIHAAQLTASATCFDVISRGCGVTALAGNVVNTTQMVSVAGSAQQSVPVEPLWPNTFSRPLGPPSPLPKSKAKPRGRMPSELWLRIIRRAVSGFNSLP